MNICTKNGTGCLKKAKRQPLAQHAGRKHGRARRCNCRGKKRTDSQIKYIYRTRARRRFPSVKLELDGSIEKLLDTLPAVEAEDRYRQMLAKQRRNILYNDSVDGVNRTDFKVYYRRKGMPAELCSTGEQKSLLISIILAQSKCQTLHKGFAPVLLLDEVVAHLDDVKEKLCWKSTGIECSGLDNLNKPGIVQFSEE